VVDDFRWAIQWGIMYNSIDCGSDQFMVPDA
jgi:hypothetical protein